MEKKILSYLLVLSLFFLFLFWSFHQLNYQWNWSAVYEYRSKFISGWLTTVAMSLASLILSSMIGLCGSLFLLSRSEILKATARVYIETIRGTPFLVQLLIIFYVVANALGIENRYFVGIVCMSLFSGAYMAEIIRGAVNSIEKGQLDSARAIGLTSIQTYRLVIFPQAMRLILPSMAGQFVSLIKDSSLLSVLAISEFTLNVQEVNSFTYSTMESYLPLALGYLLLTMPLSLFIQIWEKRWRYEA
ncbi:MAG: amino acid ABC transporter permease [Bacteriovoracaceae bacterium]|nr:amino acid ABC transporter permease [Bacteriovoracaceae bacterium]